MYILKYLKKVKLKLNQEENSWQEKNKEIRDIIIGNPYALVTYTLHPRLPIRARYINTYPP
jgi:hypothetical protein